MPTVLLIILCVILWHFCQWFTIQSVPTIILESLLHPYNMPWYVHYLVCQVHCLMLKSPEIEVRFELSSVNNLKYTIL